MTPEMAAEFRQIGTRGFERGWVGCAEALVDPEVVAVGEQALASGAALVDVLQAMSEVLIALGKGQR